MVQALSPAMASRVSFTANPKKNEIDLATVKQQYSGILDYTKKRYPQVDPPQLDEAVHNHAFALNKRNMALIRLLVGSMPMLLVNGVKSTVVASDPKSGDMVTFKKLKKLRNKFVIMSKIVY